MSTLKAAGVEERPGIVCMSPQSATSQPAPVYARTARTGTVKPVGALSSSGSCDSERWVFAMQIGTVPRPCASKRWMSFSAAWSRKMPSAPYARLAMASILSAIGASSG